MSAYLDSLHMSHGADEAKIQRKGLMCSVNVEKQFYLAAGGGRPAQMQIKSLAAIYEDGGRHIVTLGAIQSAQFKTLRTHLRT